MISVIVPVYNVEKYLRKCLDSIVNQTYRDLEIILVDDGSPDNCGAICDEYAKKDERIKVIHKANGGVSSARNAGLKIAEGDCVQFIDSDDFIEECMIEKLYKRIQEDDSDIAVCRAFSVEKNGQIKFTQFSKWVKILDRENATHLIFQEMNNAIWNKLFKRSLAQNIYFEEGKTFGEDPYFLAQILNFAQKVSFLDEPLYYYRQRENSITSATFSRGKFDQVYFKDKMYDYFLVNFPKLVFLAERWRFTARLNICRCVYASGKENEYSDIIEEYKRFMKEHYKMCKKTLKSKEKWEYRVFRLGKKIYRTFARVL